MQPPRPGQDILTDSVVSLRVPPAVLAAALEIIDRDGADALSMLWVPIIHPRWSGGISILVEGAAEPVPSADTETRDPLRFGNRFG